MKKTPPLLRTFAVALLVAPFALSAQSTAASAQSGQAMTASGTASAATLAASAHAAAGSLRFVSAIAAVPVWIGGAGLTASGQVSTAAGRDSGRAATTFWNFASDAPTRRPALDRDFALPPRTTAPAPCDPPPAEAFKRTRAQ